jgi:hypothetical protein
MYMQRMSALICFPGYWCIGPVVMLFDVQLDALVRAGQKTYRPSGA